MQSSDSQTLRKLPVEFAVFALPLLANELRLNNEPMYDLTDEKNIANLAYLCDLTETSYMGEQVYKTIEEKAAILFCRTTKNHLFPNGNKRTAVILTLLFLAINHHWLVMSSDDIYALSLKIARTNTGEANVAYNTALEKIKQTIIEI